MKKIAHKNHGVLQPAFLNYSFFFAILLVLVNNSFVTSTHVSQGFISFLYKSKQPEFLDAAVLIGNLFTMPLMVFLFGISVYQKIHTLKTADFIKKRFLNLLPWFLISAFITMPISYYLLDLGQGYKFDFWNYFTKIYFANWLTGPAWMMAMIAIFDIIFVLLYKFCPSLTKAIFSLVKTAKVYRVILTFFLISVMLFFLNSEFSGSIKFYALPDQKNSSWFHLGPIWLQKGTLLSYFAIYLFSVFLGSSQKFLDYIFSSKNELSKKWLHKILETIILYLIIKFLGTKTTLFGSTMAIKIVLSFFYMLLLFNLFSTFFSILGKFAYRKSKFLNAICKYSKMIYALHFLPLVLIKSYFINFQHLSNGEKTYVILIFTFFSSLIISYMLKKTLMLLPNQLNCDYLCK